MYNLHTITFHFPKNYGAFLQAYALTLVLKNCSCINFIPDSRYLVSPRLKKKIPFAWRILAAFRWLKKSSKRFDELIKLQQSDLFKNVNSIKNYFQVGCYIAGSDQIWNPNFISEREDIYFLNFSPYSSKRISYAASLGMKQWPKDFEQRVLPMLQRFDAISVREESSVPYLTSLGLKNVVCVCDPTILHKGDFYKEQFPTTKVYKEEYVFVYKIREQIPKAVQEIFPNKVITVDLQKRKTLVSVTDWLSNIDNAKFVVTDSFHCAVFCILFHKPFLVIPNQSTGKGMNERFATLLGKTSLEYRCLSCEESTEQVLERLNLPIDWDHVDAVLEEWRTYSSNWLKNALEI